MKIAGRTFVVSGGASGLGRACVEDLVRHGASAAILDINPELGHALAAELGDAAAFFGCDVADTDSIAVAVAATVAWVESTGRPLGGLIAAAGIGLAHMILDCDLEPHPIGPLRRMIDINLVGSLDLARQVLPHLARSPPCDDDKIDGERGVIVLVSSVSAYDGQRGMVAYSASKGGLAAAVLPMARDLGTPHRVRALAVAPGMFATPMTEHMPEKAKLSAQQEMVFPQRLGRPDEFALLVRHAVENVMLNGVVLRLDGALRLPSRL